MQMEITQNGGSMEYFEITLDGKTELSERRQVVCRLVWDQDVECSIHSAPTSYAEVAQ